MQNWRWLDWYPVSPRKTVDDHLAGLERSYDNLNRPDLALKALLVLTVRNGQVLAPEQLQRVAACVAQEQVNLRVRGWSVAEQDSALTSLLFYRKLLHEAGAAAVPAMRWLLAQPPCGAGPAMRLPGMPWTTALRPQAEIPLAQEWPVRGAKLIALEILEAQDDRASLPAVLALATAAQEDPWTRCDAGLLALSWADDQVAEQVAVGVVDGVVDRFQHVEWFTAYAMRLAERGALLIPHIVGHLGDPSEDRRQAAVAMLIAMGPPAVEPVIAVIDAADNLDAMTAAAAVLAKIAPVEFRRHTHKLAEARRRAEEAERGLSIAKMPEADASRGLSLGDEP